MCVTVLSQSNFKSRKYGIRITLPTSSSVTSMCPYTCERSPKYETFSLPPVIKMLFLCLRWDQSEKSEWFGGEWA